MTLEDRDQTYHPGSRWMWTSIFLNFPKVFKMIKMKNVQPIQYPNVLRMDPKEITIKYVWSRSILMDLIYDI